MIQLLNLSVEGGTVILRFSLWLILILGGVLLIWLVGRLVVGGSRWKPQDISLGLKGLKVRLVPDDEVARIAHQAWTELASRKAGILVEEDDVIVEVYNSWYALFGALRQLVREVPVSALHRSSGAKKLLETLMETMNEGLRPHLTKYQARFRNWWGGELDSTLRAMSPQERQREYPGYEVLFADMREVNRNLMDLAEALRKLAHEREETFLYRRFVGFFVRQPRKELG